MYLLTSSLTSGNKTSIASLNSNSASASAGSKSTYSMSSCTTSSRSISYSGRSIITSSTWTSTTSISMPLLPGIATSASSCPPGAAMSRSG
ncbi:unnamed protein product [Macrosiphum euphorbiae]|uniref:Uncharacterized protein n=1 Tax=Macrosiphum euphorbiae TaxID=13131 RepID=A0AAV0YE54_9HEMI|nr:unnamed protein product [Macrosiphum euphorbiae]